ncbi:ANTAR domain-containing protein [Arthrobacter sp. JZ12]|uniref:ANTAR domain-containing protein n=1 Tax=Arthrobacter sp. JZ12 TaxID=2654190 RepID=UPI002B4A72B8|nr:ANTAR domain-containing protein [Arthrobacter sp. JZ12]WRH23906.1 ANTAR domain-containing protein [Arthrobacter sp. JZ12]
MSGFTAYGADDSSKLAGDEAFRADTVPTVLIDRDLTIRAVNPAFTRLTGREEDSLVSVHALSAFPENPDDPKADAVVRLGASFERVLRTGVAHNMVIQRYDLVNKKSGKFEQRHWVPYNVPILHEGRVVGIRQRIREATVLRADALAVMEHYRDVMNKVAVDSSEAERHRQMVDLFADGIADYKDLAQEVAQLREALSSRATIEQAKGMLMLSRGCSADEAFSLLRQLSQDTNVRLIDVAAALIYQLRNTNRR